MSDPCRSKAPTPPDPAIRPGDIRDRAMRAVLARGPVPEDPEKTRASQEYWRQFREGQKLLARAEHESARLGRPPAGEVVTDLNVVVVTTWLSAPYLLRPFTTRTVDNKRRLRCCLLRHRSRGIAGAPRTRGVGQSRRNQ